MKLPVVNNTSDLLGQLIQKDLYDKLIHQLNKDFTLIGLDVDFNESENPLDLFNFLCEVVTDLIQKNFTNFLNLLYRIDINEQQITTIINSESTNIEQQISFVILKREWQKVWFKTNFIL